MLTLITVLLVVQQEGAGHRTCQTLANDLISAGRQISITASTSAMRRGTVPPAIVEKAYVAHRDNSEHTVAHAAQIKKSVSDLARANEPDPAKRRNEVQSNAYSLVLFLDLYYRLAQYHCETCGSPAKGWLLRLWKTERDYPDKMSHFWEDLQGSPRLRSGIRERGKKGGTVVLDPVWIYKSWENRSVRPRYTEFSHPACEALARDLKLAATKVPSEKGSIRFYSTDLTLPTQTIADRYLVHLQESEHTVAHSLWMMYDQSAQRSFATDDDRRLAFYQLMAEIYSSVLFLDLYYELNEYGPADDPRVPPDGFLKGHWSDDYSRERKSYFWRQLDGQPVLRPGIREYGSGRGLIMMDLRGYANGWRHAARYPRWIKPWYRVRDRK